MEAKSWALAKGSYLVDRLLGGRGAQDDVARVVARWESCFHLTTMGGIPVYVVEYIVAYRRASAALLCSGCGVIGRWPEANAVVSRRISGGLAVVFNG